MQYKVAELEGPRLDYWVGRANGLDVFENYYMTNPPKLCGVMMRVKLDDRKSWLPFTADGTAEQKRAIVSAKFGDVVEMP